MKGKDSEGGLSDEFLSVKVSIIGGEIKSSGATVNRVKGAKWGKYAEPFALQHVPNGLMFDGRIVAVFPASKQNGNSRNSN